MTNFTVWYARDLQTHLLNLPYEVDKAAYVHMGNFESQTLNSLYALLNDGLSAPNPLGSRERQDFIRHEMLHTSMSVGDLAEDRSTGKLFMCAPIGWESVTFKNNI